MLADRLNNKADTANLFYISIIAIVLGIAVGTFWSVPITYLVWLMLMAVVSLAVYKIRPSNLQSKPLLYFGLVAVFFVVGLLRTEFYLNQYGVSVLYEKLDQSVTLTGLVVREPELRETNQHLYVQVENDLLLVTTDRYSRVSYGDVVSFSGVITRPTKFDTDLGRTFNYPGYLLSKGVELTVSLVKLEVESSGGGNFLISNLLHFKSKLLTNLDQLLAEPAAGLGKGLLLGVKQALGEDLELAFRQTGLIHIVVLSGYNIMLVVLFVMFVLGYFLPIKIRIIVGIISIALFALLVGLSATVLRACLMAGLLLMAQFFSRKYLVLRGLMVAGILMLMLNPLLLVYDVGFQLSFLATLGLILFSPKLEKRLEFMPNFIGMRGFLIATIATQIAVLPILLYQIGEFSVVSVLANMLVLPAVPVAMLLTFLVGLTAFISSTVAGLLAFLAYLALQYINELALYLADLPLASFVIPPFSIYLVALVYLIFAYLLWRFREQNPVQEFRLNKTTVTKDDELQAWTIVEDSDDFLTSKK